MSIRDCISWPCTIFSWCCGSWTFHEALMSEHAKQYKKNCENVTLKYKMKKLRFLTWIFKEGGS